MQTQPNAYTEKAQKMGAKDLLQRSASGVYSMNDGEAKTSRFDSVTKVLYVEDDEGGKNLSLDGQGVSVQGNTTSPCPSWATSGANAVKYGASKDTRETIYDVTNANPMMDIMGVGGNIPVESVVTIGMHLLYQLSGNR